MVITMYNDNHQEPLEKKVQAAEIRLKKRQYQMVGEDKHGKYYQNSNYKIYLDNIGIFIYIKSKGKWTRVAGYPIDLIPWDIL